MGPVYFHNWNPYTDKTTSLYQDDHPKGSIIEEINWLMILTTEVPSYTTGKKYGIFGEHNENTPYGHSDLLEMAWHQPQASIVTLMQLSRVMSWTRIVIYNIRNWSYTIQFTGICRILILGLKLPTTSRISIIVLRMCANFACIQWFVIGITHKLGSVARYQFER